METKLRVKRGAPGGRWPGAGLIGLAAGGWGGGDEKRVHEKWPNGMWGETR